MKLSDAILMGDSLKKPSAYEFLPMDHSCGCALGGARLAAGFRRSHHSTVEAIKTLWPWIAEEQIDAIGWRYCQVANGRLSIEQLCDYVRSIEPAEPLPLVDGPHDEGVYVPDIEDPEEYWSDADTTREMHNSIKGR